MKRKEYCYKAVLNDSYVLFIGCPFGMWHVFAKYENGKVSSIYGGYKNIGTAERRLLQSANSYHSNPVNYYYASKALILKNGAFGMEDA